MLAGWFTLRLWWLFALTAVAALAMAYFGSYYRISRAHFDVTTAAYGHPAVFDVPPDQIFQDDEAASDEAYLAHVRGMILYAPAHWIDENVFGGPPVHRGGIRRLTK